MTGAATVTVREAVLDLLRAFGMTTVFGNPGSTELPMFRDFPADFRYVLGLQESIVVGMADGYAQATRRAALVNLHSAAGVGHAMGNLFTAYKNRTPLVVTAGQQARAILPYEPFLFSREATELPKPYVKWSCEPARAGDVPHAIARAYYQAMQPPQGPTFVSIPVDDWDRETVPLAPRQVSTVLRPDPAMLAATGDALDRARRPALVVGAAVDRDDAAGLAVRLAERHEALVWVSPMSARCGFPERHPLFAGFLPAAREGIAELLAGHDVVLALGAAVFTYHTEGGGPFLRDGTTLFQVTDDPDAAAWLPVGTSIQATPRLALGDLLDRPPPRSRARPNGRPPPPRVEPGNPIPVAYLMQTLSELRGEDSVIVEEAPSSRPAMQAYLPIVRPGTFYTCASGGLGHGLPAAVGVALARPGQRVIALLGDGSALYAIQGLWSAAQLGLPITFLIVRNGRYEALHAFGRHFGLPKLVGTALPEVDFVALARGQGCEGVRVARAEALEEALRRALRAERPYVVEVVTE
ncbi:MAG: benzoylformate decarboxylase [Acetobacteraceae bacterium]|nr:benzoylformate decarboxylase [Acetobacteraceae bacterium]